MKRIPFSEDEINNKYEFPSPFPGAPPITRFKTPISPAENYEALFKGEIPLWLPSINDIKMISAPFLPDNIARNEGGKDFFGLDWEFVEVVGGATRKPGKPFITDMNGWKEKTFFPNLDKYPWETIKDPEDDDRFPIISILNGLFERLISFMDFEGAAMALIDEDQEEAVLEFFDVLADFYCQLIDKYLEYADVKMLNFHDDWGSQRAPFFSPNTVKKMLLPSLTKIMTHARNKGLYTEMHSCGKNEMLTPIYIEAGIQAWTPQPMNDVSMLHKKYGEQLVLGVSPPNIAINASEEELYAALEGFIDEYCQMDKPPVSVFTLPMPGETHPKMDEAIYKLSRIALNR